MSTCGTWRQGSSRQVCLCTCDCGDCIVDADAYYDPRTDLFLCVYCHAIAGHLRDDAPGFDYWEDAGRFPRGQYLNPPGAMWSLMRQNGVLAAWPRKLRPELVKPRGHIADVEQGDEDTALAWQPVDLQPLWDGTYQAPEAHWFPRPDGVRLLYKGAVHSFHGEFESGKSWCALAATYSVLAEGGSVLYLDAESTADVIVGRLKLMGVHTEVASDQFSYLSIDTDPRTGRAPTTVTRRYQRLTQQPWDLVVVDGVTEAMNVLGGDTTSAKDVAEYLRVFTRPFRKTGAAVVVIDHVTKDNGGGKAVRSAQGSQHKQAGIDAAYSIVAESSPTIGKTADVVMYVTKDRLGYIRQHASTEEDRMQVAAVVNIDSRHEGRTNVTALEPSTERAHAAIDKAPADRGNPESLVVQHLHRTGEATEASVISSLVGIRDLKQTALRQAINTLVYSGIVHRTTDQPVRVRLSSDDQ